MSEYNQNNTSQNPSGIWQNTWAQLFQQFNVEMMESNYLRAYKTIQLLKAQIPTECEADIQKEYDKLKQIIKKPMKAYTTREAIRDKKNQLENEASEALLDILTNIKKSLYARKWINKDMGFTGIDPNKESKDL